MSRSERVVLIVAVAAGVATPLLGHLLSHHQHPAAHRHSVSHLTGQLVALGFGLGLAALAWPMAFRPERVWTWNERHRTRRPWSVMGSGKPPASIGYLRAVGVLFLLGAAALLLVALLDYLGVVNAVAH